MSAVEKIQAVLNSGLLLPQLTIVPTRGATQSEIVREQELLGRELCPEHAELVRHWNGIALEVIRLFGCGPESSEIGRLSDLQLRVVDDLEGAIVVGADASGFAYIQTRDGRVFSLDTDGGKVKQIAENLDDLFERLIFGPDADVFAGQEWLTDLRSVGIV